MPKARYLYSAIASAVQARLNCMEASANESQREWKDRHEDRILRLCADFLPSGSGFDRGTQIDLERSHADRLVFQTAFHHMNDGGFYADWTEHTVTVTPAFDDIRIRVSGRDRNDIKDYIAEEFRYALSRLVGWGAEQERYVEQAEEVQS